MLIGIFGTGSIGKRHAANIQKILPAARLIFFRENGTASETTRQFGAKVAALDSDEIKKCQMIIIANPSALHCETLKKILLHNIPCYIEKPVVTETSQVQEVENLLGKYQAPSMVGCNLRFLPSLVNLKKLLDSGKIGKPIRASLEAGQWLPDWRKHVDYRNSYSADKTKGGGVIFDLIHEIDTARWLFGEFDIVKSVYGKFSDLEINSEDVASIILAKSKLPPVVSINIDYISRKARRKITIIGDEGNLVWDFQNKILQVESADNVENIEVKAEDFDVGQTYISAMSELIAAIKGGNKTSQTIEDGLNSSRLAIKAKMI